MRDRILARPGLCVLAVVVVTAAGCAVEPLAVPDREVSSARGDLPAPTRPDTEPSGRVTVAYPAEPASWTGPHGRDPAADDLAALWGLPLLRLDAAGQVRRGLVEDWEVVGPVGNGWAVDLRLREGQWSDGSEVRAGDVVASLQRRQQDDPRFTALRDVTPRGDHAVRLVFTVPFASWADLLVEAGPMRPASGAPEDGQFPVAGGWFRFEEYVPGRSVTFVAHPSGALGTPALEAVEVLFVPDFDTALGLLDGGSVDMVLGHLPINPEARAQEIEDVEAAAPVGGTTIAMTFSEEGAYGGPENAERRRGVAEAIDVDELVEGVLGPQGEVATSPWPGVAGPDEVPVGEVREGQTLTLVRPGDEETLGFTARVLQRDLAARGITAELLSEPAPRFAAGATSADVALQVLRTPPRPSLAPWIEDAVAVEAGGAGLGSETAEQGLVAVAEAAIVVPLYRIGVVHAWRDVAGVRPSAWPGIGFWNAGEWRSAG